MVTKISRRLDRISEREQTLRYEREDALRTCGWKCSSVLPGALWLWSKSFPESKMQSRWVGVESPRREPHPPFAVNGTTTDVALRIESAWQDYWQDEEDKK